MQTYPDIIGSGMNWGAALPRSTLLMDYFKNSFFSVSDNWKDLAFSRPSFKNILESNEGMLLEYH